VQTDDVNPVWLKHGSPECAEYTGIESTELVCASPDAHPGNSCLPNQYFVPSRSVTVQY